MNLKPLRVKDQHDGAFCSYYGSLDPKIKPKYGVHYQVLDEYLKRSTDHQVELARKELGHINDVFRKSYEKEIKELSAEVRKIGDSIDALAKFVKSIISENELKLPKKTDFKKDR